MTTTPLNIAHGSDNAGDSSLPEAAPDAAPEAAPEAAPDAAPDAVPEATRRKRGEQLEQAIRDACAIELALNGYPDLSIESVAARAQTGKASIYRRWPTKLDLVLDTVVELCAGPLAFAKDAATDELGTTRDALFEVMQRITALMSGPKGEAMRAVWSEAVRDSGLAQTIQAEFFKPRLDTLLLLLHRGVERGEVRPDVPAAFVHDAIGGALSHRILLRRETPTDADLEAFLDGFVMPAISPRG